MEGVLREYFAAPAPASDLLRAYEVQCEALWAQSHCVNPESVCVVRSDEPAYFRFMSLLVAMKKRGVRPARKTLAEVRAARLPVMPLDDWGPLTDELLLKSAAWHPAAAATVSEDEWARVAALIREYCWGESGTDLLEAAFRALGSLQARLQGGDDTVAARHDRLLDSLRAPEGDAAAARRAEAVYEAVASRSEGMRNTMPPVAFSAKVLQREATDCSARAELAAAKGYPREMIERSRQLLGEL